MSPPWLIELPTCASTNTWVLDHSAALAHGACVYTQQQTAGRGQPGTIWHAPPGVLTASFVVDLHDMAREPAAFALAAGLAVAHAVEDHMSDVRVLLKWPNDCLVGGRKLAGILCERPATVDGRLVVGIGLNRDPRWDDAPLQDPRWMPTSLAECGDPVPDPLTLLTALRRYLLEAAGLIAAGGWARLIPEWSARDVLRDRPLRLVTPAGPLEGIGAGIDAEGRLLVRTPAGVHSVASARSVSRIGE